MRSAAARLALSLVVLALPARADILLDGNQHIGDNDTTGDPTSFFVPGNYVTRNQARAYPSYFSLSSAATVTGVTLSNPIGIDGQYHVEIDGSSVGTNFCAACATCTGRTVCASSITITFTTPQVLSAGIHTLEVDGQTPTNDIGFSALTLVSTATTTSRMLNQRRHIGDDNDANDQYDITDTVSPYYPDAFEGSSVTSSFTIDANRWLTGIQFRRLRDVDVATDAVAIDGTSVGTLANTGDPLEADPTTVAVTRLLTAGTHTITVTSGSIAAGNLDSFSWDDIILLFSNFAPSGTPGSFNAVDSGANFLAGSITTKIAGGGALAIDLYALNGAGNAVETGYAGTATVEVLNAGDNSGGYDAYGCRSSWSVAQSLGPVAFTAGVATLSPTFLAAGLRVARIRITDATTLSGGCSVDDFAIRPNGFGSVAVMHSSETSAGVIEPLNNTGTSGLPRHRAGQPFTILATAVGAGGAAATSYDGTPTLKGHALAPAMLDGATTVTSWISLGGGSLETDTAKYFEAGPATLELYDDTYANVDVDDSSLAQRTVGPTYVNVGRFIPDHFTLTSESTAPSFAAACSAFTYVGQPFTLTPSPYNASITAVAATGTVTQNYGVAALYGLPAGNLPTDTTFPALTGVVLATGASPDHQLTNLGNGVTRYALLPLQYQFVRGTPTSPYDAEIAIQPGALNEADGVDFSPSPGRINAPTAGNGVDFIGTGADPKQVRFGRLVMDNAHGSERLPLDVPLRAEYWYQPATGTGGFITSPDDGCTSVGVAQIAPLTTGTVVGSTSVTGVSGPLSGIWKVQLAAPNVTGWVTVQGNAATLPAWLLTDTNGDNAFNEVPQGLANFGLYNDGDTRIYQREVVQ